MFAERAGNQRPAGSKVLLGFGVILTMIFCLFPFYWLVNTSLKTGAQLSSASLFPSHPTLDNFQSIFKNSDFTHALRNSVIVAGSATILSLVFGAFAAYALARLRFRGKFAILAIVLSISTFPPIAIAAPVFKLWTDIGFYNSYQGLILPFLTFTLPLTIYILTSFFNEIPKDLEEAAMVDGATHFQAFRKVVVPLAAPGLVTAGLLAFISAWNEYLFALSFIQDPDKYTVPLAITSFVGESGSSFQQPWGTIMAATIIVTVPLVALVLVFQRYILAGLTAGAVKG
jgi:multiple sugar transport system permease protein